ncbi:MAG: AI-2E family transporter [Candidatus Pacebacteria bacterium]|nr:AI-2E family transporter [Candidatus Paceibacterota bacterium]
MKDSLDKQISINITSGAIFKAGAFCALFWFLWVIRDLILVLLASVIIASSVNPIANFISKKTKAPRLVSVLGLYAGVILFFIGIFSIFLPPFITDIKTTFHQIPFYIDSLSNEKINEVPGFDILFSSIRDMQITEDVLNTVTSTFSGATFGFLTTASAVFGGALSFLLIVIISFYLSVQEDGVRDFLRIVTPLKHEKYILDLWKRSQRKIGLWMQGQLLLAVIVGVLTFIGLSVIGVPNAILLSFIAMVLELIPLFGPILAAIPAVSLALLSGGVTLGLITLCLFIIIQQFENHLIQPLVVKKIVGIPVLVSIFAIIIGAKIAGFLGILISVPIAAVVMEFLGDLEKKKTAANIRD